METDGFGINIEAEDKIILADAILELYKDEGKRARIGERARQIAQEQFDRPYAYRKILELMERLMGENA